MDHIIILIFLCTAARGDQFKTFPLNAPWGPGKEQRPPFTLSDYEQKPITKGLSLDPIKQDNIHSFSYPNPYQQLNNDYSRESYPEPAIKSDLTNSLGLYQSLATENDSVNSPSIYRNTQIIGNEQQSLDTLNLNDDFVKLLDLYPNPQTVDDLEKLICKLVKIHGNIKKYSMTNQPGVYLQHDIKDHVANLHGLYSNSDVIDGIDHELCNIGNPDMKQIMTKLFAYYQACARKDAMTNPLELYQNSPVNGGSSNAGLYQNHNVNNGMDNSFGFYSNPEIMDNFANSLGANENYGMANQFGFYSNQNNIKDIAINDPRQNSVGFDQITSFEEGTTNSYYSPQNLLMNNGLENSFGVNLLPVKTDNMISSSTPDPNAESDPEIHEDEMESEFGFDEESVASAYKNKIINNSTDFHQKLSANDDSVENPPIFNEDPNINDDNMANLQDVYKNPSNFNDENVANSLDVYQNSNMNGGSMANPLDVYENPPNIIPQNIGNTPDMYQGIIDGNTVSSIDQNPNIKDDNLAHLLSLNENSKISYSNMTNALGMYQNPNFYNGSLENAFDMYQNPNFYDESMINSFGMHRDPNLDDGNIANSFGMYQNPDIYDGNTANSFGMYENPNIYEGNIANSPDFYHKPAINVGFANTISSQKPSHDGRPNSFGFYHKPNITGYEMEKLPGLYQQPDINNNMADSFDLYNNLATNDKYYSPPGLNQNLYTNNGVENSFGFYKNPGLDQNPYTINNYFSSNQKPASNIEVAGMFGSQKPSNYGMSNSFGFYNKPDITGYDMANLPGLYQQPDFNNNIADSVSFYKNPVLNDKYYSLPNQNLNSGIPNSFGSYENPGLYQNSYINNGIKNPSDFYQNTGLYQNPHKNNGIANYFDFDQKPGLNQNTFINSNGIYRPNDMSDSFGLYQKPSFSNFNMASSLGFYNKPGMNANAYNDRMTVSRDLDNKLPEVSDKEISLNPPNPAISDDIEVSHDSSKNSALELADSLSFNRSPSTNQDMAYSHSFPNPALNMVQSFARIPYNGKMALYRNSQNPTNLYGFSPSFDINTYLSSHFPMAGQTEDGYGSPNVNNLKVPMAGIVITKGRDVDFPSDEILDQIVPKSDEIKDIPSYYANPNLENQESSIENNGTNVSIEDATGSQADMTPSESEEQMDNSWWADFIKKAGFVLQNFKGQLSGQRRSRLGEHGTDTRAKAGLRQHPRDPRDE